MSKTEINEVEINGVQYVRKDSITSKQEFDGEIKIVVLQRGWIYIGRFERNGNDCKLHNAYNIRSWGLLYRNWHPLLLPPVRAKMIWLWVISLVPIFLTLWRWSVWPG